MSFLVFYVKHIGANLFHPVQYKWYYSVLGAFVERRFYLDVVSLHVTCCVSEKPVHDEALWINAVDQRIRRLNKERLQSALFTIRVLYFYYCRALLSKAS